MTGPARLLRLKGRCTDPTPPIARSRPHPPHRMVFGAGRDLRVWPLPGNTRFSTFPAPPCRPCREGGAGRSTSRRGGGGYVLLIIINYFWALPRIPLLGQHKRLFGEVASFDAFPRVPDSSQFSSVQSVSQSVGLGRPLGASPDTPISMEP